MRKINSTAAVLFIYSFCLLVIGISIGFYLFGNKESGNPARLNGLPTLQPTEPVYIKPTVPASQKKAVSGKSHGVFFPFSQGITINNPLPTIIGKISQTDQLFLSADFVSEKSPVTFTDEYFLRFIPGRAKNLELKIDDVKIRDVFAIPQYPTVSCKEFAADSAGSECLVNKKSEFPPLLFFAKPGRPLSGGRHIITLESSNPDSGGLLGTMEFYIDPDAVLPAQNIFTVDRSSENYFYNQYSLFPTDNCSEGYYYDKNFLKIPLPVFDNPNLFYGIAFPQAKNQVATSAENLIQVSFSGIRFELFFPQSSVYYQDQISNRTDYPDDPFHQLFLPKDQLVFSDGSRAEYGDISLVKSLDDGNYDSGFFEVYPFDLTGGTFRDSAIPWVISNSSSCDG